MHNNRIALGLAALFLLATGAVVAIGTSEPAVTAPAPLFGPPSAPHTP